MLGLVARRWCSLLSPDQTRARIPSGHADKHLNQIYCLTLTSVQRDESGRQVEPAKQSPFAFELGARDVKRANLVWNRLGPSLNQHIAIFIGLRDGYELSSINISVEPKLLGTFSH